MFYFFNTSPLLGPPLSIYTYTYTPSTDTTTSIMAASIIFSVYVQRKAIISPHQYLLFEAFKSLMATGLWLWLILDAAFGPWVEACRKESWCHYETGPRVTRAGLASVVLL